MTLGTRDLDVFFTDFADEVEFDGKCAKGIFDAPGADSDFGEAGVSGLDVRVLLPECAFPVMPAASDRVKVNGKVYAVRKANPLDDGKVIELRLRAA